MLGVIEHSSLTEKKLYAFVFFLGQANLGLKNDGILEVEQKIMPR